MTLEEPDPLLEIVPLPDGHPVEVVPRHVEGHLEVGVAEVLLQVAPVEVGRQLVVGGEEDVQRVHLVLPGERLLVVVPSASAERVIAQCRKKLLLCIPTLHRKTSWARMRCPSFCPWRRTVG